MKRAFAGICLLLLGMLTACAPHGTAADMLAKAQTFSGTSAVEAVPFYAAAIQKNPRLAAAYLGLSVAEERGGPGYFTLAADAARKGIAVAPKDYRLYQQLADVEFNQDKPEQGTADELHSVSLVPATVDSYSGIADKLTDLKQWDAAISVVDKMISIAPSNADFVIERGRLYRSEGDYEEAHHDFARAISIGSSKTTNAIARSEDALTYLKENRMRLAQDAAARSLEDDPGCYPCAIAAAKVYAAALKPHLMFAAADAAVRDAGDPMAAAWARKARGDALLRLGRRSEAYADYHWILSNTSDATLNAIVGGITDRLQLREH